MVHVRNIYHVTGKSVDQRVTPAVRAGLSGDRDTDNTKVHDRGRM